MSQSTFSFGVSEPFRNQSNPSPIRASASVRQCLDHIASSMGETIHSNAVFGVSSTTLPTGAYGQEARFTFDPSQRNTSGYSIGSLIRAAREVEDRVWDTEEGRLQFRRGLTRVMHANQRTVRSRSLEITREENEGNTGSSPGSNPEPETDDGEHPTNNEPEASGNTSQDGNRQAFDQEGTITPSIMAGWLRNAGYPLEPEIPQNSAPTIASSSALSVTQFHSPSTSDSSSS
jgi:hypothetical protein